MSVVPFVSLDPGGAPGASRSRAGRIVVLKFGSSVLRTPKDLPQAVHDIYAHVRAGERVLAVVSAFAGVTDGLFARGRHYGIEGHALADLVATGERDAAASLASQLESAGIPAQLFGPRELGLRASGPALEATPVSLEVERIARALGDTPVLVLPGYVAFDERGRSVLLGRGGSDLTALYLAHRLGARCRLVKDVRGVYDHDPAGTTEAHRYARIGWRRALAVAGELIQPRALEFARAHGLAFDVGATGGFEGTHVGAFAEQFTAEARRPPCVVALLGLGTVGLGVYRHLVARPDLFRIHKVIVRDAHKPRSVDLPRDLLSTDLREALAPGVDAVIETLAGSDPASDLLVEALGLGRTVVSANKAAITARWDELAPFARGPVPLLHFSGAVGGGVPVLETIRRLRREKHTIASVRGVLNGTCNYILDCVERGDAFEAALARARALGFAEADPSADLEGLDAARKLQLIACAAGAPTPPAIEPVGIARLDPAHVRSAHASGRRIRLVAHHRPAARVPPAVHPVELDQADFLAQTHGEENRVEIELEDGTLVRLRGKGAGRAPTAVSVLGDLFEVLRSREGAGAPVPAKGSFVDELALHERGVAGE